MDFTVWTTLKQVGCYRNNSLTVWKESCETKKRLWAALISTKMEVQKQQTNSPHSIARSSAKCFQPCGHFNYSDPFHGPVGIWIQRSDSTRKVSSHQIGAKLLGGFFLHWCSHVPHTGPQGRQSKPASRTRCISSFKFFNLFRINRPQI